MTASTLTPVRHPINHEVIDSPACSMPEYASYRRRYYLVSGSYVLCATDTYEEMLDKGLIWNQRSGRIVRVPVVPYYDTLGGDEKGRAVGRPAWGGGTWGGRCGSSIWINDSDRTYQDTYRTLHALDSNIRYIQEPSFVADNYHVDTTQAWWINGCSDNHPSLDGFWVECRQTAKHLGLCSALDRTWNWRDYAPWTDQGHDTQLNLF